MRAWAKRCYRVLLFSDPGHAAPYNLWRFLICVGEPRGNKGGGVVWPYTNEFICPPNTGYSLAQQQQALTWDLAFCLLEYVVCPFNTYHVCVCASNRPVFPNKTPTTKHHEQGLSQAHAHLAISRGKRKRKKEFNQFNFSKLHTPSLNQHQVSNTLATQDFSQ